jgi:glutathione gamma-glutamylcysteinyltransferase
MVLNAMRIDPGPTRRPWRQNGVWRWFDERVLDLGGDAPGKRTVGKTLQQIKVEGVTLDEFHVLAELNGTSVEMWRPREATEEHTADDAQEAAFRAAVVDAASSAAGPHMVVSFDRKALMQTGSGHFSPVAGYHAGTDSALVLDVARFKYPPYWVPVPMLWGALKPLDAATGLARGYAMLTKVKQCPIWDTWKSEQDQLARCPDGVRRISAAEASLWRDM